MYARIIREALQTPWLVTPRYLAIVQDLLRFRASGGRLTAEEIQARIGAEAPRTKMAPRAGTVAVIPVHGLILHRSFDAVSGATSTEILSALLQRAVADEEVTAILLDMASPGGTSVGVPELADEIYAARQQKYICAVVNGEMCSAAHWLGSQAHEVVSIPSGYCCSIGVYCLTEDWSEYLAKEGIKINFIHAGEEKIEHSRFWEPLSDAARQRLQDDCDRIYDLFLKHVARGRGMTARQVKEAYGQGRVLHAKDALAAGAIDRIATVSDTIVRLASGKQRKMMAAGAASPSASVSVSSRAAMAQRPAPRAADAPMAASEAPDGRTMVCHPGARFMVGDAVRVKPAAQHDPRHADATLVVRERAGDLMTDAFYAVELPDSTIHRWYRDEELEPVADDEDAEDMAQAGEERAPAALAPPLAEVYARAESDTATPAEPPVPAGLDWMRAIVD